MRNQTFGRKIWYRFINVVFLQKEIGHIKVYRKKNNYKDYEKYNSCYDCMVALICTHVGTGSQL